MDVVLGKTTVHEKWIYKLLLNKSEQSSLNLHSAAFLVNYLCQEIRVFLKDL